MQRERINSRDPGEVHEECGLSILLLTPLQQYKSLQSVARPSKQCQRGLAQQVVGALEPTT